MIFSPLGANDACWALDGKWPLPTRQGGENLLEKLIKNSLLGHPSADVSDPLSASTQLAGLWLAGYSPAKARQVFAAVLKSRGGGTHRYGSAYAAVWPGVFMGEIIIPEEWLSELKATSQGPWSNQSPAWLREFFDPQFPSGPVTEPNSVILASAERVESLKLLLTAAPGVMSAENVLRVLGSFFETIALHGSSEETSPAEDPSSAETFDTKETKARKLTKEEREARWRSVAFGEPTDSEDYSLFRDLFAAKGLNDQGIPLNICLTESGIEADHFGSDVVRFPEFREVSDPSGDATLSEYRGLLKGLHQRYYDENGGAVIVRDFIERRPNTCHLGLVPKNNRELEPLLSRWHVETALRAAGGNPNLRWFDASLLLRYVLEIMIECYYGLPITGVAYGIDEGDPQFPPLQPLRIQSRWPGPPMIAKGFRWVPFMGMFNEAHVEIGLGNKPWDEKDGYISAQVCDAILNAYKTPKDRPIIPTPAIVDLSDPKALAYAYASGDVSGLWSWRQYSEILGLDPPFPTLELATLRTSFDFKKYHKRFLSSAIASRQPAPHLDYSAQQW